MKYLLLLALTVLAAPAMAQESTDASSSQCQWVTYSSDTPQPHRVAKCVQYQESLRYRDVVNGPWRYLGRVLIGNISPVFRLASINTCAMAYYPLENKIRPVVKTVMLLQRLSCQ